MGKVQKASQGKGKTKRQRFWGFLRKGIKHFCRYAILVFIGIMFWLGCSTLWVISMADEVPQVYPTFSKNSPISKSAYNNTSAHIYTGWDKLTDQEKWNSLQPTLNILKRVCPEAEEWARERHRLGKFKFKKDMSAYDPGSEAYASYAVATETCTFSQLAMREMDGIKASIIAHEFRHSRQSYGKYCKSVIAEVSLLWSDESVGSLQHRLIEIDAMEFEKTVLLAIYNPEVMR